MSGSSLPLYEPRPSRSTLVSRFLRKHFRSFLLSACFLWGLALSWRVWRTHPWVAPVIPTVDVFPLWLIFGVVAFFPFAMALSSRGRRASGVVLVLVFACTFLGDLNRIQPWAWQYVLVMTSMLWWSPSSSQDFFRPVAGAIYFWSGVHKLNSNFTSAIFPTLIAFLPGASLLEPAGSLAPFFELGLGVALFFGWLDSLVRVMLLLMHVFILITTGLAGFPSYHIIVPWNLYCVVSLLTMRPVEQPATKVPRLLLLVAWVAPILFFITALFPTYMSWSMFGGDEIGALFVAYKDSTIEALPSLLQHFWYRRSDFPWWNFDRERISSAVAAHYLMHSFEYPMYELGLPFSPERWAMRSFLLHLCRLTNHPDDLKLVIQPEAHWFLPARALEIYHCKPPL